MSTPSLPRLTHTYTQTHVWAVAPCGHRNPVPNEAYDEPVELEPCPGRPEDRHPAAAGLPGIEAPTCGKRWIVAVIGGRDPEARFVRADAAPIAIALTCSLERTAADFGMVSIVPPHGRIWEGIGLERQAHMLATVAALLEEGIIERGGSAHDAVEAHVRQADTSAGAPGWGACK